MQWLSPLGGQGVLSEICKMLVTLPVGQRLGRCFCCFLDAYASNSAIRVLSQGHSFKVASFLLCVGPVLASILCGLSQLLADHGHGWVSVCHAMALIGQDLCCTGW